MHIRELKIEGIRCIEAAAIVFRRSDDVLSDPNKLPNVSLLLGNNGVGKTTVLKSIAMAVLAPVLRDSGFAPYNIVRRVPGENRQSGTVSCSCVLHWQDLGEKKPSAKTLHHHTHATVYRRGDLERLEPGPDGSAWGEQLYNERSPAFLLVGYGATRRVETGENFRSSQSLLQKSRRMRYQRVAGLFEEQVPLTPLAAWLPELQSTNKGRHTQVIQLLHDLLPAECVFEGERTEELSEFIFKHRGIPVPFGAMSDGYRAYIGWVADLLYHVCMGCPNGVKLVDNHGVVLVDEIDLHLHPEWQREVVPLIAKTLPNLQLIFTSHSPIVAGTLHPTNIFVLEAGAAAATDVKQLEERVHGLNADQVLVSSYFGLKSTRAPDVEDELRGIAERARTGDQKAAVDYLKRLSGPLAEQLTASPRKPKRAVASRSRSRKRKTTSSGR